MSVRRMLIVTRCDLRQVAQSPDFWVPMAILAAFFFVIAPASLLSAVSTAEDLDVVQKISSTLTVLPDRAQAAVPEADPATRTSYALAVYLFAPLGVIVPMTISTAIGANALVGERERGTGEFLAHSPASESEIYLGKLLASLLPGYLTTVVGFGAYAVVVNLIVGSRLGRWFFPTGDWWLLMFWVVPPFLALTLSLVLRLSARVKSAAAAQQASGLVTLPLIMLAYGQSSGFLVGGGIRAGITMGVVAWTAAIIGLARGARAVTRERLLGVDVA